MDVRVEEYERERVMDVRVGEAMKVEVMDVGFGGVRAGI